ncbi:dTMP kinase [uncultured Propionivibrio sp.]|uniref:dTMP kinase n=1 Tax=uncultured Propionivibrio sp. TaxID=426737 RepID=UPI0029C0BADC|nr:dTMP kinase [uncultured Propionivibrio sp.]
MSRTEQHRGKFITFEGIDGAGKSTHIAAVADLIRRQGTGVVCTREPGGTPLGEKLRELLLNEPMHLETEALLMFAARREHLALVIEPALARGDWVVSDRFSDATYAYQGGGRGLDKAKFAVLEQWVHGHLQPDLTFLFDLPPSVAEQRIQTQGRTLDRFELEKRDFHRRVREAYLERAAAEPQRIVVINADQPVSDIKNLVEKSVLSICL